MTGRATTQAISATELTEGDSDTLRIRHRLEALADASNRIPRLVTPAAEDISAEPSGKAPATKRSRASSTAGRTRATKANETKANDTKASDTKAKASKTREAKAAKVNDEQEAPDDMQQAPVAPPTVSIARTMPTAIPAAREYTSRAFALVAALALATVAAYFSVTGMAEIFPGDPVAVMVFAATMEAGKLVIAGWLAAHWRRVGWSMRAVLVTLVAGLALINATGVFGKLVEAHVSVAASTRSSVTERMEALDARVKAQSGVVADLDSRVAQIDRAVDESTRRGRVTRALDIATQQRVTRALSASMRSVTPERAETAALTCASTSLPNTPAALISARPATRATMTERIFQLVCRQCAASHPAITSLPASIVAASTITATGAPGNISAMPATEK